MGRQTPREVLRQSPRPKCVDDVFVSASGLSQEIDVTFSAVGVSAAPGEVDGDVSGCAPEGCVFMLT